MREAFCFVLFSISAIVLQMGLAPAVLPSIVRPDLFLLIGLAALLMGPYEFGLACIFAMGLCADLFGSARFGMLTMSYLLTAGILVAGLGKESVRGDTLLGGLVAVIGTVLAHGIYILLSRLTDQPVPLPRAGAQLIGLAIAATVFCLPILYATGKLFFKTGMMTGAARDAWLQKERVAQARKRRTARA